MNKNKKYFIRANGQLVSVTEDVYREYYKMDRRERYLEERDIAHGRVLYNNMDTDEILGEETIPDMDVKSVEQIAIDEIVIEKLRLCLDMLPDKERELVDALFFKGYSEREWSVISGIPRKTIGDRRNRILAKLKNLLEN